MRVAHIEAFSGASGDMFLGAVVAAGADLDRVVAQVEKMNIAGWEVAAEQVLRGGITATRADVRVADGSESRAWRDIRGLLEGADLGEAVRERSLGTFRRLATAEATIHGQHPDDVHFHEVGGVDAIVDIVGTCAGLDDLGVKRVTADTVTLGRGWTHSRHGPLPVPAPAVLELLRSVPTRAGDAEVELCTPTGAALLAEWVDEWGPMPTMRLSRVGYGAGGRQLERPNVLRISVGDGGAAPGSDQLVMLEATIDDMTGELVPHVLDTLRTAGALDAWARPVVMKKGRPGIELVCVTPRALVTSLRSVLFRETTTLGVRAHPFERCVLEVEWTTVQVDDQPVRIKLGLETGRVINAAPEYEDCVAVAQASGLPLKDVYQRALAAFAAVREDSPVEF